MKRSFNWTGRKIIPLEKIRIRLHPAEGSGLMWFSAEISDLSDLRLHPESRLYVEPYAGSSSMRFPFGSVGRPLAPRETTLSDIDAGSSVQFRVRIVDESTDVGKILASAEGIRPEGETDDDGQQSLLPVAYRDIGEAIWQLDMPPGVKPVLVLNNRIPALAELIRTDPVFQGAVVPHALKQILTAIYIGDEVSSDTEWVQDWKRFATELRNGEPVHEDGEPEILMDAISGVLDTFTKRTGWATTWLAKQQEITGAATSD